MAKTWTNTVPQGAIGTGNAQVFDVNPVAGQFGNQLQNLRKQQELDAQRLAKSWREAQLEASSGKLWAPEMAGIEKSFIDRGIELRQKGIDPYGSSKEAMEYERDKRYVQAQQGYRKAVETQINDELKKISAGSDKYDPASIRELNDWIANTKLTDAFEKNVLPPSLRERFDVGEYLKPFKALTKQNKRIQGGMEIDEKTIDEPATQNMLIGALARDPRGANFVKEMTSGFALPEIREFAPSYADNVKSVKAEVEGDPRKRHQLAAQGILPGTPLMEEYISDEAQKRTLAKNKFDTGMKDLVAASASGLDLFRKEDVVKEDLSRERLNEQIRHNRATEANSAAKAEGSGGAVSVTDEVPLYFGKSGKEVAVGKGVVKIHIPKKNFVGSAAIDLNTGQPIKLTKSSNDYEVVSVGNYPILTKDVTINRKDGSKVILKKGALVQSDFAAKHPEVVQEKPFMHVQEKIGSSVKDRLVDYDYKPEGLTKAQDEALSVFKPAAPGTKKAERKAQGGYKIGQTDSGYKYIGGDPAQPDSWVKVN